MRLTDENIKTLSQCAENRRRVIVKGKNAIGQDFTTEGFIMPGFTKDGRPNWIMEYGFALYVGQEAKTAEGKITKQFVPLYTVAKDYYDFDKMYVQFVIDKKAQKAIFINQDFQDIIFQSRKANIEKPSRFYHIASTISDYGRKIGEYLGKPVIYTPTQEKVVLKVVYNNKGFTCADSTSGYAYRGLPGLEEGEIVLDEEAFKNLDAYEKEASATGRTANSTEKLSKLISKRDEIMEEHCQEYSWAELCNYPDEREWYTKNVYPLDEQIIRLANLLIAKFSIPCKTVKHISEVYSNEWLMKIIDSEKQDDSSEKE